jgi:Zn-finger nucleic acid-binding protein
MDLVCPKCQGTMRTYERNGVHVDQCADCRGIFLDRGELERLVDAENAWHGGGGTPAGAPGQPAAQQPSHHQPFSQPAASGYQQSAPAASLGSVVSEVLGQVRGTSSHGSSHASSSGYGRKPKKKESFLSDLFG